MTDARRRRAYLIDPRFQLKFALVVVAWGAALALALALWSREVQLQALDGVRDEAQRAAIERGGRRMLWALAGISTLSLLPLGLIGLVVSHRIAGPVQVMGYFLELLAEGRFPPPRALRRHDELKVFYERFLKTVEAMKEREALHLRRIGEVVARAHEALSQHPALLQALRDLEVDAGERRRALAEASPAPPAGPRGATT